MNPQTYTKEEAAKAIWKDLMKARRASARGLSWLGEQSLEYIKGQVALYLDHDDYDLDCAQTWGLPNTLHLVTTPHGCRNHTHFETHPCICWHRRGPDSFVRSEHIPYADDSECRREEER